MVFLAEAFDGQVKKLRINKFLDVCGCPRPAFIPAAGLIHIQMRE